MLALNAPGFRVVALPEAIDTARFVDDDGVDPALAWPMVYRFAPDEAFALCDRVEIDDPHAIVEREVGFITVTFEPDEIALLTAHMEWPLEWAESIQQGAVAGVPVKLALSRDGYATVLVARAYEAELLTRLAISPGSPEFPTPWDR